MVTLEQIKLLESKIVKAIDLVSRLGEENVRLKKRNEELEELAGRLKDEKSRVEAGIVSALERLNQFEDTIERSLASVKPGSGLLASAAAPIPPSPPPASVLPSSPPVPVPSAYEVDEDEEVDEVFEEAKETGEAEEGEETSEAELDIF